MGVSIWNIHETLSYIEFQNVKARPIEHKSDQLIKDENCLNVEIQNTSMQILSLGKTDIGTVSKRAQQLANINNCNFFHLN